MNLFDAVMFSKASGGVSGSGDSVTDISITDITSVDNYTIIGSSSNSGIVNYYTVGGRNYKRLGVSYINWGAVLMKDYDVSAGSKLTLQFANYTDGGGITSSAYFGVFTEEEFSTVTSDDERWTFLDSSNSTANGTIIVGDIVAQSSGKVCFMVIHGTEANSYTAFVEPKMIIIEQAKEDDSITYYDYALCDGATRLMTDIPVNSDYTIECVFDYVTYKLSNFIFGSDCNDSSNFIPKFSMQWSSFYLGSGDDQKSIGSISTGKHTLTYNSPDGTSLLDGNVVWSKPNAYSGDSYHYALNGEYRTYSSGYVGKFYSFKGTSISGGTNYDYRFATISAGSLSVAVMIDTINNKAIPLPTGWVLGND